MIGLVIVSHSARLAEGVRELVEQVVQGGAAIAVAGGTDIPDAPIGTDPAKVAAAIESLLIRPEVSDVLVLMDLGSAIMSAEAAFDLLPEAMRSRVHLCEAPLVEGALAAAVRAKIGGSLAEVYAEARDALAPKIEQLASWQHLLPAAAPLAEAAPEQADRESVELTIVVPNQLGLHARPAALFVKTANRFASEVLVEKDGETINGKSIMGLMMLAAGPGSRLTIHVRGQDAPQALAELEALVHNKFNEE
jgi:phosphocarrier protein FPr